MLQQKNIIKHRIQQSVMVKSMQSGFELSMPFLMVGATALLLRNLPIPAYLTFLEHFGGGILIPILVNVYNYTLGSISLLLCLTVSASYSRMAGETENYLYSAVALTSYMAFCSHARDGGIYIFNAQWLFTSLCITLLSCQFYKLWNQHVRFTDQFYTPGAGYLFNVAVKNLFPIAVIVFVFACAGHGLYLIFGQENIANFGSGLLLPLFNRMNSGLPRTILYVLLIHIFWFFGIHGTNVLEPVAVDIFESLNQINETLIASGQVPTEIYTSGFLNVFAFMGGCGSTLCLAIALFLFSKKRHNRRFAMIVMPSSIFNINEILLFGFPIVFNPTMLLPFLITPVVQTCISAAAISLGLVPLPAFPVNWTTPAIFSGYIITGSAAGSILQLVNIAVGVAIYAPFARSNEQKQVESYKKAVRTMEQEVFQGEKYGNTPAFMQVSYVDYSYARTLASDFEDALKHNELILYYQPQMYNSTVLYGAEGLLRWKHPVIGFISPLLILAMANERGMMAEMTYYLMKRMCSDAKEIQGHLQNHIHLSINISAEHLQEKAFLPRVEEIYADFPRERISPVFEVTERNIMELSENNFNRIYELKSKGIEFSIDDFGMGHNSITLLQEDLFDEIKMDGSLITQIEENARSAEIVSKIVKLSANLNYRVVAEVVETREQRDLLREMECNIFQGYYYSRPLPLPDLINYIDKCNIQNTDKV